MSEFLEYFKCCIHEKKTATLQSKFIIMLNVMPELGFPQSIVRSGGLFQSLNVLDGLSWLCSKI